VSEHPPVWIGQRNAEVAIMEMRGGTHLVLPVAPVTPGDVPFDLMVEDLRATHRAWTELGLAPGAITSDRIHDAFVVADPDGHLLTISSSHVVGEV
jgi:hypothetical protein